VAFAGRLAAGPRFALVGGMTPPSAIRAVPCMLAVGHTVWRVAGTAPLTVR